MRGWLERAARASTAEQLRATYSRLERHIRTFAEVPLLSFDDHAAEHFDRLQKAKVRIGIKIAAIALANDATVLTRDTGHFSKVPGSKYGDWSGL